MEKAPEQGYDIVYRRMGEQEAEATTSLLGLIKGRAPIKKGLANHLSDPDKWITIRPRYAMDYCPHDCSMADYPILAVFYLVPGTADALAAFRSSGEVKRGPRGAYGIPDELVPWFNNRVLGISMYDLRRETPMLPQSTQGLSYLVKGSKYALFQAFSPEFLEKEMNGFTNEINLERASWLKTSLLWTLWRSDWGKRPGQERVIEILVPKSYLQSLEQAAVSSKQPKGPHEAIYQIDPDRAIVGKRWLRNNEDYWVRAGKTKHIGIRGSRFKHYVEHVAKGSINDITDIVQRIERERPEHPTFTLYSLLGYARIPAPKKIVKG